MFLTLFDRYRTVKLLILLCFSYILVDRRVTLFLPVSGQESDKSLFVSLSCPRVYT